MRNAHACTMRMYVCKMRMQAQHFVIFCTFDLFAGWKGQKYKFYVLFITREDCGARLASLAFEVTSPPVSPASLKSVQSL